MPPGDARRVTFTVNLDTSQAQTAAQQLAQSLREILVTPAQTRGPSQIDKPIQESAKAADNLRASLAQIGKVDPTKGVDQLTADLEIADKQAKELRDTLERLSFKGGGPGSMTKEQAARIDDVYDRIEREFGREAANALRASGRTFSIGDLNAEFLSKKAQGLGGADIQSLLSEADTQLFAELEEKTRQTAAERREYLQAQLDLETKELERNRLKQELADREYLATEESIQELRRIGTAGANENADFLAQQAGEVGEEIAKLTKEEGELLDEIERLTRTLAQEIDEAEQKAARDAQKARGQIRTAAGSAAGPVAYTQQTAITVNKRSVDNAKEMTAALTQAAEASERLEESAKALSRVDRDRGQIELDTVKKRLQLQQEAAKAEAEIQKKAAAGIKEAEELEKRRTAQFTQQARARTQAQNEGERRVTQAIRAATKEREQLARAEAAERIEAAKAAARRQIEEEKRLTAQLRSESNRRQRIMGNVGRSLAFGAAGALGIYSADQAIQTFYRAGRTGAQQARTAQTFEYLADAADVSSRRMIEAISRASNGTIDDMTAIALSAQLLSQRFAKSAEDISSDTELLVAYSRRAAQIYTDEQGNFLSTQEVFARLIKFFREGNKELVDQFGLSNAAIAETLGVSRQGLASAEGATLRYQGSLKLLREELDRLGEAQDTTADRIEAAEARTTNALNRIRNALAEPTATGAEFGASVLESASVYFGSDDLDAITRQLEELAQLEDRLSEMFSGRRGEQAAESAEGIRTLAAAYQSLRDAQEDGLAGVDDYRKKLEELARQVLKEGEASDETRQATELLVAEINKAAIAAGFAGDALTGFALDAVTGLTAAADAAGELTRQLTGAQTLQALRAGQLTPGERERRATSATISTKTAEDSEREYYLLRRQEEERLAEEERRNQERIAKEWERSAKQAAEAYERELESALKSVEGLFDTSEVTDEDLEAAELGLYQEKADEYLRQLRDEVRNGVDYEGVSVEDAAARLGLDPSQFNPEQIVKLFEDAWADSSLFAGGENLDLINKEAVERELKRIEESKAGEQAILEFFGIKTAQGGTAAVASAAGAAILDELGLSATAEDGAPEVEAGAGPVLFGNVAASDAAAEQLAQSLQEKLSTVAGGTLVIDTFEPAEGAVADLATALMLQATEDTDAQTTLQQLGAQLTAYIGAGIIDLEAGGTEATLMGQYVAALRLQVDSDEDVVAGALGIGYQIGNYIGAGIIDPNAGQTTTAGNSMAAAYLDSLERQFLAEDASAAAGSIGATIKGAIAASIMNDETTPAVALDLLYAIGDQLGQEEVTAEAQAVGSAIVAQIHAGWSSGAGELNWITPLLNAAREQAAEYEADAVAAANNASAFTVNLPGGN